MSNSYLTALDDAIASHGPKQSEYTIINNAFTNAYTKNKEEVLSVFSTLRYKVNAFHQLDSIAGFSFQRPHGYAGDFEMIDRLYTEYISADETIERWDRFAQAQPAAKAVRNRKNYFKGLLLNEPVRSVLNLASGPGRDMKEFYDANPGSKVVVDCVEWDQKAIAFASQLLKQHPVTFTRKNVLRFVPMKNYDLIWSSGLFDYFSDRVFVLLLTRMLLHLNPGGQLVVGNFADTNPNRAFMEVVMNWHLNYRSVAQLEALAVEAGARPSAVTVCKEPEGVNLFLHIRKQQ
ncbi:MAG TPA: class I SAM-dependent methyltransferase [Flavisolibacter sp.]|jgi:SAM-dependent methyltransferase|nr:class I SAM-dependent methyltransferase [Flavisolibacter sp.]